MELVNNVYHHAPHAQDQLHSVLIVLKHIPLNPIMEPVLKIQIVIMVKMKIMANVKEFAVQDSTIKMELAFSEDVQMDTKITDMEDA